MISETVIDALKRLLPEENIYLKEPMKKHTTFRVGGPADCLVEIEDPAQLERILRYLNLIEIPFFVMGKGSNLLVADSGYRGIILHIGPKMNEVRVENNIVTAQAGSLMSHVAKAAYDHGLTGFEFASGIPGTIGGGVVMNAGAYGGELSRIVTLVTVADKDGQLLHLDNATMEFEYRTSVIRNHYFIVTEVELGLKKGEPEAIKKRMEEFAARRKEKQPLEYPSAGSTFKRPEGYYAGELIMNAGLKGFRIGGAMVSEKHCGFVINTGDAAARDIYQVIQEVKRVVGETSHVVLEPEVIMLGKF